VKVMAGLVRTSGDASSLSGYPEHGTGLFDFRTRGIVTR
jgi:hypothetical protein